MDDEGFPPANTKQEYLKHCESSTVFSGAAAPRCSGDGVVGENATVLACKMLQVKARDDVLSLWLTQLAYRISRSPCL